LVPVGATAVTSGGIVFTQDQIIRSSADGARVAITNDPVNDARGLQPFEKPD
jgi:ABC-type metal ion transport system substrate-binding protein